MKGDFSRSTFDPHKHYTSVRMQQGRVQLDADWNEQADILLHLIATQLQDLLGPGSTSVACPGFAITPAEQDEERGNQPEESTAPAKTLPDFLIGAGRYYVDGILCENEEDVLFSEQPDYPAAASLVQESEDRDHFLVYLDVWQRHITAIEDPAIREIALGGADTTTRVKTVWQVKLLPAPGRPADDQDWEAFVARTTDKGRLKAQWDRDEGAFLENHLYRVEIHSVAGDEVTFKWSRENGSVVFPMKGKEYLLTWEDVPGNDNERLLSYLREGLALDWAKGNQANMSKPEDDKIRVEKDDHWAEIALNMEEETATLTTSDGKLGVLKVRQENGKRRIYSSIVELIGEECLFTWEDVPGNDNERLLSYLGEGLALDWAEGNETKPSKPEDGKIRIEKDKDWAEIALNTEEETATLTTSDGKHRVLKVKQENEKRRIYAKAIGLYLERLDRDPYQVSQNDWVEIVDDVTVLNGCPLPLCKVKELDGQDGKVVLWADEGSARSVITEIRARELGHPLLRRWEDDAKPLAPQTDTTTAKGETWLSLENGIQVAFSGTGAYQVGDYWLIPARAQMEKGIQWPQEEDGTPRALPPHGVVHRYAPLALLQLGEKEWQVDDLRREFDSLTDAKARFETGLAQVDVRLDEHKDNHAQLRHRVKVLEERQADFQAPLVQYFQTDNGIDTGHVVSIVPPNPSGKLDSELGVRLASADDREKRLVVGVVKDIVTGRNQGQVCRVVVYGRAQCRVVGSIEPGDVLVPSVKLGYAQKARRSPKPGTILGKALGSIQPDEITKEEIEGGNGRDRLDKSKWTGTVDMMVMLG
jgi:hypothetical protein